MPKTNFKKINDFLKSLDLSLAIFIFPLLFGFLGAIFEGGSFGLLIPTVKGIMEGNAHFAKEMPYIQTFFSFLPDSFKDRSIKIFAILVILTFLCVVLKNIFSYLSTVSTSFQVWRFSNNLRKKIFERYLSFGKLYFDQNNIGRLQEVLTGYTRQISLQLKEANQTIFLILMLCSYLFLMFKISWKLTAFIFLLSPIYYFAMSKLVSKIKVSSESYIENYSNLLKNLSNSLLCIPLIKSYCCEELEKSRFNKDSNLVENNEFSIDKKRELISPLSEILTMCVILLLVGVMTYLLYTKKEGDVPSFMVYFVVLRRSIGSFSAAARLKAIINSISGPMQEIASALNDDKKFYVPEGNEDFKGIKESIKIKNLTFSFPDKPDALKNISLKIEKDQMTAIVGPSGSGKSTLVNVLLRFYDFNSGEIKIDGVSIKDFSLKSYHSKIAFVSQETYLFNDTLRNNLTYGLENKNENEIQDAIKKANLNSLIEKLPDKLNTEIGDRGIKLSGGEKQKLSIARAILKDADILILDEATSSLDSVSEKEIQKSILAASKNKTSIVIAHRLSTIKNADKIIVISDGKAKEEGTLDELLNEKGIFYSLWEEQKFY